MTVGANSLRISSCEICYISFADKDPQTLSPCGHSFDEECLNKWLIEKAKNECPKCRQTIKDKITVYALRESIENLKRYSQNDLPPELPVPLEELIEFYNKNKSKDSLSNIPPNTNNNSEDGLAELSLLGHSVDQILADLTIEIKIMLYQKLDLQNIPLGISSHSFSLLCDLYTEKSKKGLQSFMHLISSSEGEFIPRRIRQECMDHILNSDYCHLFLAD